MEHLYQVNVRESEKNATGAKKKTKREKCRWSDSKKHSPYTAQNEIYGLSWT